MPARPNDSGPGLGRLQGWWLELPLSYRVNALLYFLAGVALVALLVTVIGGGDDSSRELQVGAGVTSTTAAGSSSSAVSSSTTGPSTTSTTVAATTTTRATSSTVGSGGTGGGGTSGGGGGGGGTSQTTNSTAPPDTTPQAPVTSIIVCRNSTNELCGDFRWVPAPGHNEEMQVAVDAPSTVMVGQQVMYRVIATEPDHLITPNCSQVRFGEDNANADGPCTPPPCPPAYGEWEVPLKPAPPGGRFERNYPHTYLTTGQKTATFRYFSKDTCRDPYGSEGTATVTINVLGSAPTSSSTTLPQ